MSVKIYDSVTQMTGHGEEWLVHGEDVLAVFIDGNLRCQVFRLCPADEVTKVSA